MTLGEVIKGTGVERRNGLRPGLCVSIPRLGWGTVTETEKTRAGHMVCRMLGEHHSDRD